MASLKIVIRTNKKKADGTCPLALRIIKDRKTRFVFTGQYILEKDWNAELSNVKKSHPNSARLNNLLLKKLTGANDTVLEADDRATSKEIKNKIKRVGKNLSFFDIANQRIEAYKKKGTFSVSNPEQSIVNNIRKFVNGDDLLFQDINVPFIGRYKVFCASTLEHSPRTIINQLIFIRTLFNLAIKEGVVDFKYYPFAGDNIKIRIGSGLKIGLTKKEIERIEVLDLEKGSSIWHTQNVWLLAFYFAGVRISDVIKLKWSDFNDGRLNYVMHKNEKPVTLKIPEKANVILKTYRKNRKSVDDYIFPFLDKADQEDKRDLFRKSRNASRLFNKYLKRIAIMANIDKNLSNHIARHSFGNIAGDKIHPLMLQKLYRHSDLKTTINYQANFIHKEADEALDSVINF
ncbi:MAG: site-specific integrase [Candidatus Dadabacteria bacterium]|nr:site-specific integrase [Candidatus Dadabacteria bacterium]